MKKKIINLTKKLIKFKSYDGNTTELENILNFILKYIPENLTIERFEKNGIKSAIVYNTKTRPEKFKILFNCHLDIIPGKEYQHLPKIEGDKIIGVGSNDMKGNLAAAMFSFIKCAKKVDYPLAIQFVTDEEVGGLNGTKFQVESGIKADFIIATEPTNLDIVNKAKGVLLLNITSFGKTAHGSYPWRGQNAIEDMSNYINIIKNIIPNPSESTWQTTLNISEIKTSNSSFNKIPDDCTISLDVRCIPEDGDTILEKIKNSIPDNFKIDIILNEPSIFTEKNNNHILQILQSIKNITGNNHKTYGANGTSDGRHFIKTGGKSIEFGAIGGGIGEDNEWVSASSLENYYEILNDFLLNSIKK